MLFNVAFCCSQRVAFFYLIAAVLGNSRLQAQDPAILAGKELFEQVWQFDDYKDPLLEGTAVANDRNEVGNGLGPLHNAKSCLACHAGGGASGVEHNVTMITLDPRSPVFNPDFSKGLGRRDLLALFPGVLTASGSVSLDSVVHNESTRSGYSDIRQRLSEFVPGGIPRTWFQPEIRTSQSIAANPILAGRYESIYFYLNQRNPPPLFGLGLIDRIADADLDRIAVSQNRQTGGEVSGRRGIGKFGWRAQTTTLASFVRGACAGELGLSQTDVLEPIDPADWSYLNPGIDITSQQCDLLTSYVASLEKPMVAPTTRYSLAKEGKLQFYRLGCALCHVENMEPARGLYSDLLLHDMGTRLQAPSPAPVAASTKGVQLFAARSFRVNDPSFSNRRDLFGGGSINAYYGTPVDQYPKLFVQTPFSIDHVPQFPAVDIPLRSDLPTKDVGITWEALQREWRTPPLWGLADSGPYLHDGRARSIDEAIRWHGGEATEAAKKYDDMTDRNRDSLLAFFSTLISPGRANF